MNRNNTNFKRNAGNNNANNRNNKGAGINKMRNSNGGGKRASVKAFINLKVN